MTELFLPLKTTNDTNTRQDWRVVWRRAKKQRAETTRCLELVLREKPALPCVVTLTRHSVGEMDDDGAISSMKHCRDGIADWLGVNDRDRHIVRYDYDQRKVRRPEPSGVHVSIRPMTEAEQQLELHLRELRRGKKAGGSR